MIDRSLNYGRPVIRRFLQTIRPYKSALDIGAGTGVDLSIVQDVEPSARIHGLEAFPPYAEALRARGWMVHAVDLERDRMPFEPGTIDVVVANQVLEHVKEIFWIFDQIALALSDGGHLIVGVPNLASLHNRLLLLFGRQPTSIQLPSAHIRGYTRPGLLAFLDAAAPGVFRLERHAGSNFYPFPPILARPLAAALPSLAYGAFFLLKKVGPYRGEFLDFAAPGKLETNYYVGR